MLIYNSQKEFIGIDPGDLRAIGFETLADLQIEATDFSDLFLRTPGYIHNFKYVHWIDYIAFEGSLGTPQAIIHTQKADYSCSLSVSRFFVSDSPASDAYAVHLHNIKLLTPHESAKVAEDISKKAIPDALDKEMIPEAITPDVEKIQSSIEKQNAFFAGETVQDEPFLKEESDNSTAQEIFEDELLSIPDEPVVQETENLKKEESIAISQVEEPQKIEEVVKTPVTPQTEVELQKPQIQEIEKEPEVKTVVEEEIKPELKEEKGTEKEDVYVSNYVYDPQVASDELGLPIDLIEEFIEDFIAQAKEFKDELYKAIDEKDINNLRILSHKLKGVAANLRIEDALEVLVIVNTSDDLKQVKTNLNYFYSIIHKLDSAEQEQESIAETLVVKDKDEDDFVLDFKDTDEEKTTTNKSEYNKEEVAKTIGLDMDTFNDLFNDYLIDAEDLLSAMQQLIESDDLIHLKKHIIKLEGMNKNMMIDSFSKELQTLLDTPNQEVARKALATINTKISSMKD